MGGAFKQEELDARIEEIKHQVSREDQKHLKQLHQDRLARMTHKIAEI